MSATCPTCSERALILWYATGALQEDERIRVGRALSECAPCQAGLDETRMMSETVRTMEPTEQLSPEQLVAFAETSSDPAALDAVDREVVQVLRSLDAELSVNEQGWLQRLQAAFSVPSWLLSPTFAYVLLAALAYPAYLGVSGASGLSGDANPLVLSQPLELDSNARSAADNRVNMRRGQDRTVLTVFVAIQADYRYRLLLRDRSGRGLFVDEDADTLDGYGVFALLVPSDFLGAGDYELVVEEIASQDSNRVIEEHVFPFQVE